MRTTASEPDVPRLRMFAGPNGSGKSTLVERVGPKYTANFVNADIIEAQIRREQWFDFARWEMAPDSETLLAYFTSSTWLQKAGLGPQAGRLTLRGTRLYFPDGVDSYLVSVLCDFLRRQMVRERLSFTFETVMSAPDKVEFLAEARAQGYRTYLYFVATDNPLINVARVNSRVIKGGHPVPENKIITRYYRALDYLVGAVKASDRAYLWDNTGDSAVLFAEYDAQTDEFTLLVDKQPQWFQTHILDKL